MALRIKSSFVVWRSCEPAFAVRFPSHRLRLAANADAHRPLGIRGNLVPALDRPNHPHTVPGFAAGLWQPTLDRTAWAVRFKCLNARDFR